MEMGYLMALHARLGVKIGDLHAKDSNSFHNRLMVVNKTCGLLQFVRLAISL